MITRELLNVLREDVNQALASVGQKHNLSLEVSNIRFGDTYLTLKVDGKEIGCQSREELLYTQNAAFHGLPPLGSEVTLSGTVFVIKGMKARGKNCILIDRKSDGKEFVSDILRIVRATPRTPKITLAAFAAEANRLSREHVSKLNTDPMKLFGAEHFDLPESLLSHYHGKGYTPQQALDAIAEESAAEMRAEAKAS